MCSWLDADPYAENARWIRDARERLEALGDGADVGDLAGCFHTVRLAIGGVRHRVGYVRDEARQHYPPAAEDSLSDASSWPAWRMERFVRWKHECEEADRNAGVAAAERAAAEVDELMDDIVARIELRPALTLEEAESKLWVLLWHYDAIVPGIEPLAARPLWKAAKELGALIPASAASR